MASSTPHRKARPNDGGLAEETGNKLAVGIRAQLRRQEKRFEIVERDDRLRKPVLGVRSRSGRESPGRHRNLEDA
jgi:hypothetical protein